MLPEKKKEVEQQQPSFAYPIYISRPFIPEERFMIDAANLPKNIDPTHRAAQIFYNQTNTLLPAHAKA